MLCVPERYISKSEIKGLEQYVEIVFQSLQKRYKTFWTNNVSVAYIQK